jgi:hypothetical protein
MKEFRKENDKVVCEECRKLFVNINGLAQHVNCYHDTKEYFDKWLKEKGDDSCKICGEKTKFRGLRGYNDKCSKKCAIVLRQQHLEENNLKKYGVKNSYQRKDIKEKCKQIHLENLGVENPRQSKMIQEKAKQTSKERYGDENYNNTKKNKETCFKNFGVEHPYQNPDIFLKTQIKGFKCQTFKNTDLYYRGSYELDFLENFFDVYPDIINAPSIKYMFDNKIKIYFPDFFIPSLNLIIEIKSLYYFNRFKDKCIAKEKATITNGFNYLLIINKDYSKFIADRYHV